jgi:uncharacterized membrane protein HdeD (DUF308 family)
MTFFRPIRRLWAAAAELLLLCFALCAIPLGAVTALWGVLQESTEKGATPIMVGLVFVILGLLSLVHLSRE